jgi:alpha-amylase
VSELPAGPPPGERPPENEITLVLIVHDHQPVGNFDHVIRDAHRDAYAPFLEFLESHPQLRIALHTSGPLLEWLEQHEPRYLDRLRRLVSRGQVEPWGGAFYEPILPVIPERDRRGQIAMMTRWIERRFGVRPRGLWLAERVWEPSLASSLAEAGIEYTAADDAHFVAAGLEREALWHPYLTEDQGLPLHVLPIHRELRYAIPFADADETVALLADVARRGPDQVAVLGDDGEKFGSWPGTRERCYQQGWLESFVRAIDAAPWIRLRTPAEAIARHAAHGPVYLPSASYHEMQEWSLPPAAQERYEAGIARLESAGDESARDRLRGGHWRGFLTRYPEANRLHKRMLRASRRLARAGGAGPARGRARQHLWRSQCNCPYWHGVFGGLYLPHLRAAAYSELIAAESIGVRGVRTERGDVDFDGWDDALLESPRWAAWISARGGRMWAFDDRHARWNWGDTMAQRLEHYHARLAGAEVGGGQGETIHAAIRLKEPGLDKLLDAYDPHLRDAFLDRWREGSLVHDWSDERAPLETSKQAIVAKLEEGAAPALEKRWRSARHGGIEVRYALRSARRRSGELTVEINAALHVREAPDRWIEVNGEKATPPAPGAEASHAGVTRVAFVDDWAGRRLEIECDRPAQLHRAPIDTVSLSESGAERVFQGVESRWTFPVTLEPGEPWSVAFTVRPLSRKAA